MEKEVLDNVYPLFGKEVDLKPEDLLNQDFAKAFVELARANLSLEFLENLTLSECENNGVPTLFSILIAFKTFQKLDTVNLEAYEELAEKVPEGFFLHSVASTFCEQTKKDEI